MLFHHAPAEAEEEEAQCRARERPSGNDGDHRDVLPGIDIRFGLRTCVAKGSPCVCSRPSFYVGVEECMAQVTEYCQSTAREELLNLCCCAWLFSEIQYGFRPALHVPQARYILLTGAAKKGTPPICGNSHMAPLNAARNPKP